MLNPMEADAVSLLSEDSNFLGDHMLLKNARVLAHIALFAMLVLSGFTKPVSAENGVAFGLNGISDWSTQHPFIDVMKSARPWIGHLPDRWGGADFDDMRAEGVFDDHGWPVRIPDGLTKLEALILTDQSEDARHLNGRYVVRYEGRGNLSVTGRAKVVTREPGRLVFRYTPGPGSVGISIAATHADDPIRDIEVIPEKYLDDFDAGAVFNPDWLDRLGQVEQVRFMDWMFTNGSPLVHWAEMPTPDDFSYVWRGVPVPVMINLANSIGADPWFNIPHLADDDLVRRFAETVKDDLDPDRMAYIEFSNEVWNFIFEQSVWARDQAEKLWGETADGWVQFYGLRAAEVMKIWSDVYGTEAATRMNRVVAVHTGWPELEQSILFGDRAVSSLGHAPVDMFDSYAVTGYFAGELGEPEVLGDALEQAAVHAEAEGRADGLSRVALREYVKAHQFSGVESYAAELVRSGSLRELTEDVWPYHARVASDHGLELIMYEGGTHATPYGGAVEDERLVGFLKTFNYSTQMAEIYQEALDAWSGLTDSPFNAFVDVAAPSKWGSWGALRHLSDDNPRWQVLRKAAGIK